jgi:replicative DNA helicase
MASFNDTVDLERAYLKSITSSVIMARTYLHQGKEEMFTSDPRKVIFELATAAMADSNSILTKKVFEYEIGARVSDNDAADFICEWNMMEALTSFEAPEALLSKLKEANTGRMTLKVSEEVVEMLTNGRIQDAVAHLKREAMMLGGTKEDRPVVNLTDIDARIKIIRDKQQNPQKYQGLKTGLATFDAKTGGLFAGELTLIAGITGLGKSTICRSIAVGLVTLNGAKNVLHIANEEYLEQVQYKYDAVLTGIPYQDFKFANITDEALDRWQKFMQQDMKQAGRGQIFVKEVPAFTDVSLVEQQFRILENRGIPIHAIIIDHLPHVKPIQQAWGENDERAKAATDCKELAKILRVPVITPTQASTDVEKKQMSGKRAGKLDVYGSKGQIHVANTFMIITYKGTDDTQVDLQDYERDVFWLCDAKKNRDGSPFYFMAKHMVKIGRVIEVDDPGKKPAKEAVDAVTAALKAAGEAGKPKVAPAAPTAPVAAPTPPTAIPAVLPVAKTGLRDASMEAMEAIEGDEEDEEEVKPVSAEESGDISAAVNAAIVEAEPETPAIQTAAQLEEKRIEVAATARPQSALERAKLKMKMVK